MYHISENFNYSNQKIHSNDQIIKIIVYLGSNKCEYNKKSTWKLNQPQNSLLTSIVDNPENYV